MDRRETLRLLAAALTSPLLARRAWAIGEKTKVAGGFCATVATSVKAGMNCSTGLRLRISVACSVNLSRSALCLVP